MDQYELLKHLLQRLAFEDDIVITGDDVKQWPAPAIDAIDEGGWISMTRLDTTDESNAQDKPLLVEASSPKIQEDHDVSTVAKELVLIETLDLDALRQQGYSTVKQVHELYGDALATRMHHDLIASMTNLSKIVRETAKAHFPTFESLGWCLSRAQVAEWVAKELGLVCQPQYQQEIYPLYGMVKGIYVNLAVLDMNDPICLFISGRAIPLIDVILINKYSPVIEHSNVLAKERGSIQLDIDKMNAIIESSTPVDTVAQAVIQGVAEHYKSNAKKAANARHDQPGGTRDNQRKACEEWASGKYPSRDHCAYIVSAKLGVSWRTVRKALMNTPDPVIASESSDEVKSNATEPVNTLDAADSIES